MKLHVGKAAGQDPAVSSSADLYGTEAGKTSVLEEDVSAGGRCQCGGRTVSYHRIIGQILWFRFYYQFAVVNYIGFCNKGMLFAGKMRGHEWETADCQDRSSGRSL